MSAYAVGQVVYLLQTKSLSVVPVQVAEQITKNTLVGSETVYNVKIPGKEKMLDLSSFDGEVFENLSDVKDHMITNITYNIEKMISQASEIAKQSFPEAESKVVVPESVTPITTTSEKVQVDLGNGTLANVSLPPEFRDQ
tara:strand:- start:204 stop:623 length:420 start_codon:yes stop_codon:yes gene_type:complete